MAQAPYPINPALTAIAVGYRNPAYIADLVLPRTPVETETFRYMVYPLADAFTADDTLVGRKSAPNQIDLGGDWADASTEDHGLSDVVPVKDRMNAESLGGKVDPEGRASLMLTERIALGREIRAANLLFNAGNYPAGQKITLSGTSRFSDFANSDPLGVLLAGLDACLVRPNTVTFGNAVWTKLRQHPRVVKAVLGNAGDSGVASRQALAGLLEVDNVYIGVSRANTAKRGQSAQLDRIWGNHVAMTYVNPLGEAVGVDGEVTFAVTAQWGERVARSEFDSKVGLRGGTCITVGESVRELIIAPHSGYFIENAI